MTDTANEIWRYIATVEIEYFSNMHLKELPYYQAIAWMHLGEELRARAILTKYSREWQKLGDIKDNGFFGTMPFFISFIDDPIRLRSAQHAYLMALCHSLMGKATLARVEMEKAARLNSENLFAFLFYKFGF